MRISKKGTYAIEAMIVLAQNKNKNLSVSDIATLRNCSFKFLEHIFRDLKKADLVISTRGKHGGYRLSKAASAITCKDIMIAIEEQLGYVGCNETSCSYAPTCLTKDLWSNIKNELLKSLTAVNLQTLADAYEEALSIENHY